MMGAGQSYPSVTPEQAWEEMQQGAPYLDGEPILFCGSLASHIEAKKKLTCFTLCCIAL